MLGAMAVAASRKSGETIWNLARLRNNSNKKSARSVTTVKKRRIDKQTQIMTSRTNQESIWLDTSRKISLTVLTSIRTEKSVMLHLSELN